jgi:carbamoyltransferase
LIILGVTNTPDSGAALIVDGRIVAAANEERFVRKKLVRCFPSESIAWVLASADLGIADVDWVGSGCWKGIDQTGTLPILVRDIVSQAGTEDGLEQSERRVQVSASRDDVFRRELFDSLRGLGVPDDRILCCDHHYSHALTAFYPSPFDEALVFTADGRGDFRSVTLWEASRADGLRLVDCASEITSPGALYGLVTKLLGFVPDRHEGKVTGLAAHGTRGPAYDLLRSIFFYDEAGGRIRSRIGPYFRPFASAEPPGLAGALEGVPREDVAYAVQRVLEEVLRAFLLRHIGNRPPRSVNLCLAGGCMSNVKLNYELAGLPQVRGVYVFPQMGDGGNALGGAMAVAVERGGIRSFEMPTVYLGPEYGDAEIETAFRAEGVGYRRLGADAPGVVADLVAAGRIVGWYQGQLEYGPRALGSRSILAQATDASINTTLNARLHRTEFMPFAPVTIDAYADRCFEGWAPDQVSSQFMTICYRATELLARRCPAVVHVDGTARPQVVFREHNPAYYDVVRAYIERTGNPALINTSFNHHEEPIVNTPQDAVRSLRKGNVDVLVAGRLITG